MRTSMATVGRPTSQVKIPRGKFTFQELCALNPNLAPLTLRNFMKRDFQHGNHSQIIKIDEKGEPGSNLGYGRKPNLYIRREMVDKNGTHSVRNINYHVHRAKSPNFDKPQSPKVVNIGNPNQIGTTSVIISFAPVATGSPVPTSVTVNFNPNKEDPTQITTDNPTETIPPTPQETSNEQPTSTPPQSTDPTGPTGTPPATAAITNTQPQLEPTPPVNPQEPAAAITTITGQPETPEQPPTEVASKTKPRKNKKSPEEASQSTIIPPTEQAA